MPRLEQMFQHNFATTTNTQTLTQPHSQNLWGPDTLHTSSVCRAHMSCEWVCVFVCVFVCGSRIFYFNLRTKYPVLFSFLFFKMAVRSFGQKLPSLQATENTIFWSLHALIFYWIYSSTALLSLAMWFRCKVLLYTREVPKISLWGRLTLSALSLNLHHKLHILGILDAIIVAFWIFKL